MLRRISIALVAFLLVATSAFSQNAAPTTNLDVLHQLYLLPQAPLIVETDVTVGTTATLILNRDGARVEDVVSDTGTSNCAIRHDPQVTITNGILLGSGGGTLAEDFRGDLSIPTQQMWAVCASSGGTLHVLSMGLQ